MRMAGNILVPNALPVLTSRLDCQKRTCRGRESVVRGPHPSLVILVGFVWFGCPGQLLGYKMTSGVLGTAFQHLNCTG